MLKEIKLMLEYGGWPLWLIYDDGEWTDLPDELKGEEALEKKLDRLQEIFNGLYIDTEKVFDFHGFHSRDEEREFERLVREIKVELKEKLPKKYPFVDHLNPNLEELEPADKSDPFYQTK